MVRDGPRREDKSHDVGDSKPGDVGDSKGTHHDRQDSPMARIHNRRDGELMTKQEVHAYLSNSRNEKQESQNKENEDPADRWEDNFDRRHLPNGMTYEERQEGKKSNRESLLESTKNDNSR